MGEVADRKKRHVMLYYKMSFMKVGRGAGYRQPTEVLRIVAYHLYFKVRRASYTMAPLENKKIHNGKCMKAPFSLSPNMHFVAASNGSGNVPILWTFTVLRTVPIRSTQSHSTESRDLLNRIDKKGYKAIT